MPNEYESEQLRDISALKMNMDLPIKDRFDLYINQIVNPYHFKSGDVEVHISYREDGKPLETVLKNYFINTKL